MCSSLWCLLLLKDAVAKSLDYYKSNLKESWKKMQEGLLSTFSSGRSPLAKNCWRLGDLTLKCYFPLHTCEILWHTGFGRDVLYPWIPFISLLIMFTFRVGHFWEGRWNKKVVRRLGESSLAISLAWNNLWQAVGPCWGEGGLLPALPHQLPAMLIALADTLRFFSLSNFAVSVLTWFWHLKDQVNPSYVSGGLAAIRFLTG